MSGHRPYSVARVQRDFGLACGCVMSTVVKGYLPGGSATLNANVHQGLHGEGFIYALASAAGFTTSKMNVDLDGVDWQIAHPGPKGTARSPRIELQVKSWSNPVIRDGAFHYRLRVDHYNKIAGVGFQVPRYLALVIVPPDAQDYATCDDECMRLGTAAYFLSLADQDVQPAGESDPKTIAVAIPQENLLTVEKLDALLGGDLEGDRD